MSIKEILQDYALLPDIIAFNDALREALRKMYDKAHAIYSGVTHPFVLNRDAKETFDDFIGKNCPPPNWNEGLDQDLTKDLHLIDAFHNLFDHTEFAITDFIYCRDFSYEIKVEITE